MLFLSKKSFLSLGILLIMLVVSVFSFSGLAGAHSGRTDSRGGHNCYVAPCAGQYHFHGGFGYSIPKTTPTTTSLIKKLPKSTLPEKRDDFVWWNVFNRGYEWFWVGGFFVYITFGLILPGLLESFFPRFFKRLTKFFF